jgi:hypothetical protein
MADSILNLTCDGASARFSSQQGDPQFAGFKLTRIWPSLHPAYADTAITALNAVEKYSTSVQADGKSYTGKFIVSQITPKADNTGAIDVVQTVTKVKITTDSSDADLVDVVGDPRASGSKINRKWYYIDPETSHTLYSTLNAITSYSGGVKANKQLYSGKYIVSNVTQREEDDRTVSLGQLCTKVTTVTGLGSLPTPLINREHEIVHPFGDGEGVKDGVIYRYINLDPSGDTTCMAISDTSLGIGDSYSVVAKKTTIEDDRTCTFWVLHNRYTRRTWHDSLIQVPDDVINTNKGRQYARKTERWFGLQRDSHTEILSSLEGSVDSGYALLEVEHKDNDDRSKDYVKRIIKSSTDTRTDSSIVSPHSPDYVVIKRRHVKYDYQKTEPVNPGTDTGYRFAEEKTEMDDNGLIRKEHVQILVSPSNTVDTKGLPKNNQIREWVRAHGSTDIDSVGKEKTIIYDRVPIANAPATILVLSRDSTGSSLDSKHITDRIGYADIGDGSARIERKMIRVNVAGKFYYETAQDAIGYGGGRVVRVWPRVWDTYADVLTDTSRDSRALAVRGFSYRGDSYQHQTFNRSRNFDRTSDIKQVAIKSVMNYSWASGADKIIDPYMVYWDNWGDTHVKVTVALLETDNKAKADTWATASDIYLHKMGRYEYRGPEKYWSYKVTKA